LNAYEEVHPLNVEIATLRSTQKEATLIAEKIGNSEFDISFTNINVKSGLGRALLEMRDKLKNLAREEYERNWVVNGIAEFGSKLRNNQELSLKQLSELLISDLVRYLEADQGAIYLFHENDESTDFPYLQMVSCYAHDRKKKPFENKIRVGEGLVGQSIQERDTLFLSEIPEDYSYLFSGLGGSKPRFVVVVPVIYNDKILGVIEIGAFNEINDYKVEFLKKFTDSFGSTVSAVSTSEITKKLLADSQAKAKELATQEEAMRQNAEELQATQEELNRNLRQIEKEAALNESILQAINKTNATLEMDLDGVITDVNDIYLSLMEYKKEEMIGKREKEFVTSDQLENNRYEMMWSSIRDGAFNSGEFKRISKSGKELWLTGTYSPIFDVDGVPYKIVQFAQFTTEQKERELELNSKLNAFNSSIPILEIKPDGSIIKGNTPFLDSFGYKRIAIRKMHFFDLFDASVDEKIRSEISSQFENDTSFKLDLVLRSADKKQRSYIANFTPTRNLAGVLNGYMVVLVDITEQRNLRNQLRDLLTAERRKVALLELEKQNSEKFAHEFVDIMLKLEQKSANNEIYAFLKEKKVPIGEVNISGEMNFCNDPFANLFGEIRSDFIGKKVVDYMVFPTEAENNIFHEMLEDEKLRQAKLYFKISEDTEPVLFNTYIVPSYKEENNELFKLLLLMNVEQINPDRTYG
ncbi:MAG: PAS domain-containing protein, partial [Cyclobacteriaceae bacterium]|nr:PAS domain-containing protein [Cyclobacteriaceae bacterium]